MRPVQPSQSGPEELWLFGGGDGSKLLNDVWLLDCADTSAVEWVMVECAGTCKGRMGHARLLALARGAPVLWRLVRGVKGGYSTQVLLLDLVTSTRSEPRMTPRPKGAPALRGRLGPAAAVLGAGEAVLFLGGSIDGAHLDEALLLRLPDSASEMVSLELLSGGGTSADRSRKGRAAQTARTVPRWPSRRTYSARGRRV